LPLAEFAVGIEAAQIIVVFIVLIISYVVQTVFSLKGIGPCNVSVYNRSSVTDDN
jgi:hypothetical protein